MLRPGGIAIIEVPAMPSLFDVYDKHLGHFRRYKMGELLQDLRSAGFEIVTRRHLGSLIFPLFWLYKRFNQRVLDRKGEKEAVVNALRTTRDNWLLDLSFRLEERLLRWTDLPFGIRCTITCRRP